MPEQVSLRSGSRAEDLSYQALADASLAARDLPAWRIVGGHMVNLHAVLGGVVLPLRATRDADLAVEVAVIRGGLLLEHLRALGYDNPHVGNRFERPVRGGLAAIDLLVPSFRTRHVPDLDAGTIAVDGVPGLHVALGREPVVVEVELVRSDGGVLFASVRIPDLPSAIAVKAFAYAGRHAPRDAEDLRRLLEVGYARRVQWPAGPTFAAAAATLTWCFDEPGYGLRDAAGDSQSRTRVRALVRSLLRAEPGT